MNLIFVLHEGVRLFYMLENKIKIAGSNQYDNILLTAVIHLGQWFPNFSALVS